MIFRRYNVMWSTLFIVSTKLKQQQQQQNVATVNSFDSIVFWTFVAVTARETIQKTTQ